MFAMTRQTLARTVLAGVIAVAPVTVVTVPAQADVVTNYTATSVDHGWDSKHLVPPGWGFFPPGWGIPPGWFHHLLPFSSFGSD